MPAYVLAIREYYPASEANWRVPVLLLMSGSGMAAGGWLAGVMYDHYGYYAPAFRSRYYYEDPVYYAPPPLVIVEPAPCYVYPRRSYYSSDRYYPSRYYREERSYYYER